MKLPEDHPLSAPTLRVARVRSTATTYEIVSDRRLGGWALCTINDHTGELSIQSDWGNWAYQWSPEPRSLGAPTLTAFLGDHQDVDYVTRKLQGRSGGEEFDPDATVRAFCRIIAKFRLKCGREAIELARDDDMTREEAEIYLDGRQRRHDRFLTADAARGACDEIAKCADGLSICTRSASDIFLERLINTADLGDLSELFPEPWESLVYRQTMPDRVLRNAILPPLFKACRETHIRASIVAANGPQPPIDDEMKSTGGAA